jgi:hypothetical protein
LPEAPVARLFYLLVSARTDWSRYAKMPAFDAANRINAYGTYLLMERELLGKK